MCYPIISLTYSYTVQLLETAIYINIYYIYMYIIYMCVCVSVDAQCTSKGCPLLNNLWVSPVNIVAEY